MHNEYRKEVITVVIAVAIVIFIAVSVTSLEGFSRTKAVREWLARCDVWADDMLSLTFWAAVATGALTAMPVYFFLA